MLNLIRIKFSLFLLLMVFITSAYASLSKAYDAYSQGDYKTALELIEPLAKQGNARAQFRLGFLYDTGKGVPQDYKEAYKWYLKSAKQGFESAQYNLANLYEEGYGVSQSYKQALKWYQKAADQGHDNSQVNLGLMYFKGKGVEIDDYKALELFQKASKQGNSFAKNNIAIMYEYGFGVKKDYRQSIKWYIEAIDKNHEEAQTSLKDLLVKMNDGKTSNYSDAVKDYENKLYDKAFTKFLSLALEDNVRAQTYVGVMFARGQWVEQDQVQAVKWYKSAAGQGYRIAQYNLAVTYDEGKGVLKDKKKAVEWYTKSAKQGYAKAQFNLALMHRNGEGVVKNNKKAAEWYTKAAKQGHARSQANLGLLYDLGEGVNKNYTRAVEWYTKASNQGISEASYNLGLVYEYGRGVEKDIGKALKWYEKAVAQGDEDAKVKVKKLIASQDASVAPTLEEARQDYDNEDYISAFPKFLKLANQGDIEAQVFLGWMYRKGWGTNKNNVEAFKWFDKLSTLDNEWTPWAQNQLGIMYSSGDGISKNIYKAIQLYRKSAESGYELAQYNLALQYERGTGVKKDINKALKWYKKAAAQGDEDAKAKVKELLALQGENNNKHTVFSGSGTGFVVSNDGVVATNYHVIDDCGRIVVDEKDAELVLQDKKNDLVLIKVDKTYDKVSSLSYRSPELGSDINVFGYPLSEMMSEKHISLTKGSVSSLAGMDGNLSNFRFTAPVQPGNSGGPIVDKEGRVVGITQAVLGKTVLERKDGFLPQNVNFGIRSSLLINMMESKMIPVKEDRIPEKDLVKHYVKATKYIKCYE